MSERRIYLFREASPPDPFEEAFRASGYSVLSIPVLSYVHVNQEKLRDCLESPHSYGGLVVTSPRGVDALVDVLGWLPSENARWHMKPAFAVGPSTAAGLREAGFDPEGEASGTAELLADHITRRAFEVPLLFLCGNRRREVLPRRLSRAGVPFEELVVYETQAQDVDLEGLQEPEWMAFFSPSGVQIVHEKARSRWSSARRAAIGPTTASEMEELSWPPDAVAASPTAEALLEAVLASISRI